MQGGSIQKSEIDFNGVKCLVTQIFKIKSHGYGFVEKGIHKICYALKEKLPPKNVLKKSLPFYWYYYGPYSEVVAETLGEMEKENIIEKISISEDYSIWKLQKKEEDVYGIPDEKIFKDALYVLSTLNVNPFTIQKFTQELYKEAPRRFRYFFYKFKEDLEIYKDQLQASQLRMDDFKGTFSTNLREEPFFMLYKAEGILPIDTLFKDFNELFSSYVTAMHRILDYEKTLEHGKGIEHIEDAIQITDMLWKIFGEGERILSHDPYEPYERKVPYWKEVYLGHLKMLEDEVESFDEHVIRIVGRDNLDTTLIRKEKEILSTILP